MGVEHYLACSKCKQFIDLHRAYAFAGLLDRKTPPVSDDYTGNAYWTGRGIWFLWNHKNHGEHMFLSTNAGDDRIDENPAYSEVFPHEDDLRLRKNQQDRD